MLLTTRARLSNDSQSIITSIDYGTPPHLATFCQIWSLQQLYVGIIGKYCINQPESVISQSEQCSPYDISLLAGQMSPWSAVVVVVVVRVLRKPKRLHQLCICGCVCVNGIVHAHDVYNIHHCLLCGICSRQSVSWFSAYRNDTFLVARSIDK